MVRVGIIGGAGYTGGEAIRILLNHPDVELAFVHSNSNGGNRLSDVHIDLLGETDMRFTNQLRTDVDALMLCVGHGDARKFLEATPIPDSVRIIDLSQDFRLQATASIGNRQFVYGLPELNREKIRAARNIANPGCFATCLQLGILPLAAAGLLTGDVQVTAVTGSTGAGQKLAPTSHFSQRVNNLSVYKAFEHQHLNEIGESVRALMPSFSHAINFIPYRGDFARGIIASIYVDCPLSLEEVQKVYGDFYADAALTFRKRPEHLSQASGQYGQVCVVARETRRQVVGYECDRQLIKRSLRPGRAEPEPDVQSGRACGVALETGRVLTKFYGRCRGCGLAGAFREKLFYSKNRKIWICSKCTPCGISISYAPRARTSGTIKEPVIWICTADMP